MKKLVVLLLAAVLCMLYACGEDAPEETSAVSTAQRTTEAMSIEATVTTAAESFPPFSDPSIARAAQSALGKEADDNTFNESDLDRLSKFISLQIYDDFQSLADLPNFFPCLRYLGLIDYNGVSLSQQEQKFIAGLGLRALTVHARTPIDSTLLSDLQYLNVRLGENLYGENADKYEFPADLALERHSVLGENYIRENTIGKLIEYVRVVYGGRAYELFVSRHEMDDQGNAWLFISEKTNQGYVLIDSYDYMFRDTMHASGGLVLADVNFDGRDDILIFQERAGNQAAAIYICLLQQPNGKYKRIESFEEILNPSLDTVNKTVLGFSRGSASTHFWSMYSFQTGEFIETASLMAEPDERMFQESGEGYYRKHVIRKRAANGNWTTTVYSPADYSKEQWEKMFFDPSSEWGLNAGKWRTLANSGTFADWSIYGTAPDAMIMRIIGDR